MLYVDAGFTQLLPPFNDAAQAMNYYQRGLDYAEQFLAAGETASGVRELVLWLYGIAGQTQSQPPFNDAAQAMNYYQRGLDYADISYRPARHASGADMSEVVRYLPESHRPTAFSPAQAMNYYQRGVDYAEQFLAAGETASGVREQVLRLYVNAGATQRKPPFNDAAQKMNLLPTRP